MKPDVVMTPTPSRGTSRELLLPLIRFLFPHLSSLIFHTRYASTTYLGYEEDDTKGEEERHDARELHKSRRRDNADAVDRHRAEVLVAKLR